MSNQTSSLDGSLQSQNIDNTLGAVFIGIVGATFLFGITTLQVYMYYHHYRRDSYLHKLAVAILWILDTVHLVLIVHATYHYAVKGFGDASNMAFIVWSVKLQVTINVIIILFVQSLYAYRVWILGGYHHGVLGYVVAGVVIGGFGIGATVAYKIYTIQMFEELHAISKSRIRVTVSFPSQVPVQTFNNSDLIKVELENIDGYAIYFEFWALHQRMFLINFIHCRVPNVTQNNIIDALQFLSTKFYVGSFLAMLNSRQHRNVDGQASSGVKPGIEFRVQMSTFTDEDAQWQHETSSNSPHSPASESQSTYVSFEQNSKNSTWHVDVEPVHPSNTLQRSVSSDSSSSLNTFLTANPLV
ncbi:hypothetical protein GG344DRAFT_72960 [Lentinula edodes]|nr:hypothetical protein GG344DRAFT_72960 [Lentinula edodes]